MSYGQRITFVGTWNRCSNLVLLVEVSSRLHHMLESTAGQCKCAGKYVLVLRSSIVSGAGMSWNPEVIRYLLLPYLS